MPCSHEHQRNAGGLIEIERVWNGNYAGGRGGNQLTVAAVDAIAEHGELAALVLHSGEALRAVSAEVHGGNQDALADGESGDVFPDLGDFARDVAA